jgi:hypothetical protein
VKQKLLQAACSAISAALAVRYDRFAGTEFSGGRITGPMLDVFSIGTLLFALALLTLWMYPRVAAVISALASLLCFPLYLYFTAPGPFRLIFRGDYSTPLAAHFRWDFWAMLGMLVLLVTTYVSTRSFFADGGARATPES